MNSRICRKWLLLANPYIYIRQNNEFIGLANKGHFYDMDVKDIYDEINNMLPPQLEKAKLVIDNLIDNKNSRRLTNIDYQIRYKNIVCVKCGSTNLKKNGHKCGTQRYKCKDCNKYFSITSKTILNNSRIKYSQLKCVIKGILDIKPIYKIALESQLSKTQIYNLEMRIFSIIDDIYKNEKLREIIQIDEKYFRISFKGTKREKMPRPSRKSGSNDLTSGISKDQICVIVAIDSYDTIIIKVVGNGPASTEMIEETLKNKIEAGSIIVTDSKSSYIRFAKNNNFQLKQIPASGHNVEGIYNLGELNSLMSEIETYITHEKRGVSTKHLQQHLNFIKYKKYLKYTFEYLEHNEEMLKEIVINNNDIKCNNISKIELPFDLEEYKKWYDKYHTD